MLADVVSMERPMPICPPGLAALDFVDGSPQNAFLFFSGMQFGDRFRLSIQCGLKPAGVHGDAHSNPSFTIAKPRPIARGIG
ncbi:hypothetical protein [Burkholderia oklahomensis]|nr:hypothetical protein [Burkholderia oklahomensis]